MVTNERTEVREPDSWPANVMLIAAAILAAAVFAYTAARPIPTHVFSSLLFVASVLLGAGLLIRSVIWLAQHNVRHSAEVAKQVEGNNHLLNRLSAQPTVNLHEVRDQFDGMQRVVLAGQAAVIRRMGDTLHESIEGAARVETNRVVEVLTGLVDKRFGELEQVVNANHALVKDAFLAGVHIGRTQPDPGGDRPVDGAVVADEASVDPQYLADMARSVELGREMERRKRMDSAD